MSTDTAPAPRLQNLAWAGIALALLGAALFATKGIIIKLALGEGIDTVTTLAWRMIVAVPIFLTVGIIGYRRKLRDLPAGTASPLTLPLLLQTLGVGVLGYYVASLLDFSALEYISAQFDRLILLTYPFFVVLFGAVFFKRSVSPPMIGALVVSYVGIAVIFWHDLTMEDDNVALGAALVFGSALAYAGYQIMAKPLIDKLGAGLFTSIAMSAAGPCVIVHFLVTHPMGDLAITGNGFLLMLAIGTVATVLPAYCISGGIALIGPERTAIIGNISPIVTVVLAVGVLGEAFTVWHAIGTALVLGGVFIFTRKQKPRVKVLEEQTA